MIHRRRHSFPVEPGVGISLQTNLTPRRGQTCKAAKEGHRPWPGKAARYTLTAAEPSPPRVSAPLRAERDASPGACPSGSGLLEEVLEAPQVRARPLFSEHQSFPGNPPRHSAAHSTIKYVSLTPSQSVRPAKP